MMKKGIICLAVVLTGCGSSPHIDISTVDGVTQVTNPITGIEAASGGDVTFETMLHIGVMDGPEEECFGPIRDVTVDSEGNVYISEYQRHRIAVFDSTGSFLRYQGRKGQGPGEFEAITALSVDIQDRLVVFDRVSCRITRFSSEGALIDVIRLQTGEPWIRADMLLPYEERFLLTGRVDDSRTLFREYDTTGAMIAAYGTYPPGDDPAFEAKTWGSAAGDVLILDDGALWYAKNFFHDRLLVYRDRTLCRRIITSHLDVSPYTARSYPDLESLNKSRGWSWVGPGYYYGAQIRVRSCLLAATPDHRILHLVSFKKEGDPPWAELHAYWYDREGRFLKSANLGKSPGEPACMDRNGFLYYIGHDDYFYVEKIRVICGEA
ncbi:6-bladed beta-propeller [bacterium]|nr:6-bladed beta-propeller [bacterium]